MIAPADGPENPTPWSPTPEHPTPEHIEQWALGRLSADDAAALEARAAASPTLRARLDAAVEDCAAVRAALQAGHEEEADAIGDDTLAAYLDDALDVKTRAALERSLARRPALLARLVALRHELHVVMNPALDVKVAEKFLSGETLPFERPEPPATPVESMTYEALADADEARKQRYLQSGN